MPKEDAACSETMLTKTGQDARGRVSPGHAVETPHCRSHRLENRSTLTLTLMAVTLSCGVGFSTLHGILQDVFEHNETLQRSKQ